MTHRFFHLPRLVPALLLGWSALCSAAETGDAPAPLVFAKDVLPIIEEYCFDCHNPDKIKGKVDLETVSENADLTKNRKVWNKVSEVLEGGDMPPEKKPQPTDEERQIILRYLDTQFAQVDCNINRNPGRVTMRRLNRSEYSNTVRDLLHVDYYPSDFPNDEVGYGFDNIGDVLSLSPLLMEKFMSAAQEVASKAIVVGIKPRSRRVKGSAFKSDSPPDTVLPRQDDETLAFFREGEGSYLLNFEKTGDYIFRIRAYGDQAGLESPKLSVRMDGKEIKVVEVPAISDRSQVYEVPAKVESGSHRFSLAFLNNYVDLNNSDPKLRGDRNLYVKNVEIVNPEGDDAKLPESHRQLITKMPKPGEEVAVARELLTPFLKRAYRRPVSTQEVDRVAHFVELALQHQGSFLEGMQVAVQAVLTSPQFLFRSELEPTAPASPGATTPLDNYQIASRLSYFLWNSMPDRELFELADRGELTKDGNLEKQAMRLLHDWRARQFINSFADQWLQIRNIWEVAPDPQLFAKWDDKLRQDMKEEVELFFQAIIQEDRSVYDLLDARFTYANERLANFYGLDGVTGEKFQRVELPADSPRGGVITMGGVLLGTSTPTRTSPVIRGKWILEQILGTPPPAPPPDVPPLPESDHVNLNASLRQRLEEHMVRPECAACHKRMDPLGFALENFDATGAWRTMEGKIPINASGKLPNGKTFNGPSDLKAVLRSGKNFKATLTEKMMTYALGRGVESYDHCAVDAIVTKMGAQGDKMSALIVGIVTSEPFLKRKEVGGLAQN